MDRTCVGQRRDGRRDNGYVLGADVAGQNDNLLSLSLTTSVHCSTSFCKALRASMVTKPFLDATSLALSALGSLHRGKNKKMLDACDVPVVLLDAGTLAYIHPLYICACTVCTTWVALSSI